MSPKPALILASTSPFRRELLERLGLPFTVEAPDVDEAHLPGEPPTERALRLAAAKAEAVALRHPGAVVIGSDQVAAVGGVVLDKPGTIERAHQQLKHLSGSQAHFHTACALRWHNTGFSVNHLQTVTVTVRDLTPAEIENYVAREQPLNCAGSFKSEGLGIALFSRIESEDPTALVGLPLIWVAGALRQAGFSLF
ncbi:MAG TPA: Maf family nucleotide pyrophosphatase [Steroidobacteraceae bacterium]|nr:Maf family nucleotide pyrophosphatase [Steroidobacteraceae bacterium]